jgi:putative membrane-bound dehydrogenase-like protein
VQLSSEFLCEGANFADLDKDGHNDVIAGAYWWEGPRFDKQHEFYEPKVKAFDPAHYSDAFFVWPWDVDGDGWTDLVTVGFPGEAAYWYRNPLADKKQRDAKWTRYLVCPNVSNESPAFADLKGDGKRELVFNTDKNFGWAEPDPKGPFAPWIFHKLSEDLEGLGAFTHGLGVGDVDGDGKQDVLWHNGWFRQPSSLKGDPVWTFEHFAFGDKYGGAQMHVMDVDGDGLPDVITSLAAHHFGLSWFQQTRVGRALSFVEHRFMDDTPEKGVDGVCFGEVHAVDIADINNDGLLDIVTGKRWWSHGAVGDPQPGSKPEVWWFELVRDQSGAHYVPHLADDDSGVGTGVVAGDVDHDRRRDIVIGNKHGVFVLFQRDASVVAAKKLAQAEELKKLEAALVALPPTLDFEAGDLRGWKKSGTAFDGQPIEGDTSTARGNAASLQAGKFWIGGYEKLGDAATGTLTSNPFPVEQPWASFLVGGGGGGDTRVEIHAADGDALLFKTSGANFESMQRVVADLGKLKGKKIYLVLVDNSAGGWGHVNFDDFRFHSEKPSFETPPGVPRILPLDELPNAGLKAQDAPAAMTLPKGFKVDLIASEPDLHQPIAFAIDDRGRLWVAEGMTYPRRMEGDEGKDDIVVFEDKDGDGTFETRTVFLDKLNLVSGLEVGFGGVWIGAAPYLLFVPDENGDLVPDGPAQKVLDGFGWQDTHETLNAFNWGPDGWLYGTHGVFTHSRVGQPGTPDAERVVLTAGVWRVHPRTHAFEVFAEGTSNPWGVDFDAHGQAIITACVVPHLFHMIQGGRYDRQDGLGGHPNKFTFDDIKTIADHLHWQGSDPWNGNNRSGATGGGHAHCGCLVYLGEQFPAEYRGAVLMNNVHGKRTNMDLLEREGSGFVGRHGPDFLLANDKWFLGTSLRCGPDGSVFVTDWYDKQACHETHPEIWDRTNGRIYRISYGTPKRAKETIADAKTEELVHAAIDGDEWHSRHARRLLQERGEKVPYFNAGASAMQRLRSLWVSYVTGWPAEDSVRGALIDPDEYVAAWAVQLLLEKKQVEPATLAALEQLATTTKSPVVRLYLASALQRLPLEQRWKIAENLIAHDEDAQDHNLPLMYWYGVEALVESDTVRALALVSKTRLEPVRRFLVRRAGAQSKLHAALVSFLALPENRPEMPWMLEEFRAGLGDQRKLPAPAGWEALASELCQDEKLVDAVESLSLVFGDKRAFPKLRARLADPQADAALRREALEALLAGHDAELLPVLPPLLVDAAMQRDVIRALASFDGEEVASDLLAKYDAFDQQAKHDVLNTLASRKAFAKRLLDSVGSGAIPRNDLSAFVVQTIENLGDAELVARLHEVWGTVRQSGADVAQKTAEWRTRLAPDALAKADLPRGREVFSRTCELCHTLYGVGGKIGPELTGSNRADLDYLLSNVLDPSAIVGKDYTTTMVWLNDGRFVNGILKNTTDSTLSLQTDTALVVVEKTEIETQKDSPNSIMPEGQLETLTQDEVRDLVAYLQSPKQVALRGTKLNGARLFDGKTLAGWKGDPATWSVEQGEIVGRTKGLAKNEFLVSELLLSDFRLELDLRLVKDEGNSGVQFRTTPREDGEVKGLQADVGPGWWGKLYEENGRGLVVDKEQGIEKDGWNHYLIEARGAHVKITLDGQICADLDDPQGAREGILALQVHAGGPTEVRFRNLKLEVLE